jgi:hypothetical protein
MREGIVAAEAAREIMADEGTLGRSGRRLERERDSPRPRHFKVDSRNNYRPTRPFAFSTMAWLEMPYLVIGAT